MTIPGIGEKMALCLIAKLGDIRRFHSANAINAYIGIDLILYESGQYQAGMHIRKRGNAYARKILYTVNRIDELERYPHFVLTINDLQSNNDKLLSLSNESTSKLKYLKISTKTFVLYLIKFDITDETQVFPVVLGVPKIDNNLDEHADTTGRLFLMNFHNC